MAQRSSMASLIQQNKVLFSIVIIGLLLIELEIFAIAALKSGRKSWLHVLDHRGNLIHMVEGGSLSSFNKYYFEKTFGPLENYEVKLVSQDVPFPFRAWFVAAIGIPVGAILLFAFVLKAYSALMYGHNASLGGTGEEPASGTRMEQVLQKVSRMNIFIVGFLILLAVLIYWIVPNVILFIGRVGLETILEFKWFFLGAGLFMAGLVVWVIYLRYLLAKKSIESQMEVEKYRLQLTGGAASLPLLPESTDRDRTAPIIELPPVEPVRPGITVLSKEITS